MKKLITPFAILIALTTSAQLSVQIIGNSECRFPYNGNEPITLRMTGLTAGQWYEIAFPTNYIESHSKPEITREVALIFQVNNGLIEINTQASNILNASSTIAYDNGTMDYTFNGPSSAYSSFNTLTQWHQEHSTWYLPPNTNSRQYYLSVRAFNSDKPAAAYFRIVP